MSPATDTEKKPQTEEGKKVLANAFNCPDEIELETGRTIYIPKWGVKKALRLGTRISNLVSEFFKLMKKRKVQDFSEAVAEAKEDGLEEGDDKFPVQKQYQTAQVADFLVALPQLMEKAGNDLTEVIRDGLTLPGGVEQLSVDQIAGEDEAEDALSLDEFIEVITKLIQVNITEKTVKKLRDLLGSLPGLGVK